MQQRFTLIFLTFFLCQLIIAQSNDNGFNIFLKTGLAGFAAEKDLSFNRKEETKTHIAGLAFAFGLGYQKAINKKGNLIASLNLQYGYAEFTRINFRRFTRFNSTEFSVQADEDRNYKNQYLQAPIYLGLKIDKFTFSIGINPTVHLKTKATFDDVYSLFDGTPPQIVKREKITGTSYVPEDIFQEDSYKRFIENPIGFQALLNISYTFKSWHIGLEVAHFLEDNYLVDEIEAYDVVGPYKQYFRQYRRSAFLVIGKRF